MSITRKIRNRQVLVIGGTGFIGFHIVRELCEAGHEVTLLCRNPDKAKAIVGSLGTIHYQKGDVTDPNSFEPGQVFHHIDALIYAVGTDERDTAPTKNPYDYFYQGNVTTCIGFVEQAKNHGVKHAIILGSFFTCIDRSHPELKLSKYHPYIRSRAEQLTEAMKLASRTFTINVVEIPFVFGHTDGHDTLWKSLVNYIRVMNPLIVTRGGANCISVRTTAKAILGVLRHVRKSEPIPIGDENLTWVELLERINAIANRRPKQIYLLRRGLFSDLTKMGAYFHEFFGRRSGLDQKHISELINLNAFVETGKTKRRLRYEGGDLEEALRETVKACPKTALLSNLQKSLDWLNDNTIRNLEIIRKIVPRKE
jgi:dihydroflavonol-4-reductase